MHHGLPKAMKQVKYYNCVCACVSVCPFIVYIKQFKLIQLVMVVSKHLSVLEMQAKLFKHWRML